MLYISSMQNMTFGGKHGGLLPACRAAMLAQRKPEGLCFMAPHMVAFIETPAFAFNSRFDQFQLGSILQLVNWTTAPQRQAVLSFGGSFLDQLAPLLSNGRHGAFISTCICHGCPWDDLEIDGRTSYQEYGAWMLDSTIDDAKSQTLAAGKHVHIDRRGPDGGGTIEGKCQAFQYM